MNKIVLKKIISTVFCGILMLSCISCENDSSNNTVAPTENPTEKPPVIAGTDSELTRDGTPKKYITMSFDDGITQDKRIIEILKKYNIDCCTFYINTGLAGLDDKNVGIALGNKKLSHKRFTIDELKSGIYDGFDVGVHSLTHTILKNYNNDVVSMKNEIVTDAENITEITNYIPVGMAWPNGDAFWDEATAKVIMDNTDIRYARSITSTRSFALPEKFMDWHPTLSVSDGALLDLTKKFINSPCNDDMLLYVWGHGYEFDHYNTWDRFEEFVKLISEAEDVVLVTNAEFYQLFKDEIPSW